MPTVVIPGGMQQDREPDLDSQEADAGHKPGDARVQVALIVHLGRVGDLRGHTSTLKASVSLLLVWSTHQDHQCTD